MPDIPNSGIVACKICGVGLRNDGLPTGNGLTVHYHHVIPQAFGGAKGPTVPLCSSDHNLLHAVALAMTSKKPWQSMVSELKPQHRKNVMYFSECVVRAFEATKNDPNKRVHVSMTLTAKTARRLDDLMKVLNVTSRQAALERLIQDAHRKYLPAK